ncbi:MAG: threonine ammonia-lyase [Candidatus Tectomicrobia bacterium]|nr:threonine ammonia-lyase [Candidatus Tectomicrobia bacterium]
MIGVRQIKEAFVRVQEVAHLTPLQSSNTLSRLAGSQVFLKMENLQKTGSFKIRGAYNKLATLNPSVRSKGVIAASAGNHAQGVAWAATRFEVPSTIVMPELSSISKRLATKGYGAEVIIAGANFDESFSIAEQMAQERGLTLIHAFDDEEVIAGQGTIGLELLKAIPDMNSVVIPIGGGGLISGVSLALKETNPHVKIIGVEAAGAAAMFLSRRVKTPVELQSLHTIADGIAVKKIGEITYPVIERYVDEIVTVNEDEIAAAILILMERSKTIVEGAGAVSVAAILEKGSVIKGPKVVALLSGGNIDVNILARIIEKGMVKSGRLMRLSVELPDIPGSLAKLTALIAQSRANILHITHDRLSRDLPITLTRVELALETRGYDHIEEIMAILKEKEYRADILT